MKLLPWRADPPKTTLVEDASMSASTDVVLTPLPAPRLQGVRRPSRRFRPPTPTLAPPDPYHPRPSQVRAASSGSLPPAMSTRRARSSSSQGPNRNEASGSAWQPQASSSRPVAPGPAQEAHPDYMMSDLYPPYPLDGQASSLPNPEFSYAHWCPTSVSTAFDAYGRPVPSTGGAGGAHFSRDHRASTLSLGPDFFDSSSFIDITQPTTPTTPDAQSLDDMFSSFISQQEFSTSSSAPPTLSPPPDVFEAAGFRPFSSSPSDSLGSSSQGPSPNAFSIDSILHDLPSFGAAPPPDHQSFSAFYSSPGALSFPSATSDFMDVESYPDPNAYRGGGGGFMTSDSEGYSSAGPSTGGWLSESGRKRQVGGSYFESRGVRPSANHGRGPAVRTASNGSSVGEGYRSDGYIGLPGPDEGDSSKRRKSMDGTAVRPLLLPPRSSSSSSTVPIVPTFRATGLPAVPSLKHIKPPRSASRSSSKTRTPASAQGRQPRSRSNSQTGGAHPQSSRNSSASPSTFTQPLPPHPHYSAQPPVPPAQPAIFSAGVLPPPPSLRRTPKFVPTLASGPSGSHVPPPLPASRTRSYTSLSSSSGVPASGPSPSSSSSSQALHAVVETAQEWVPSKPRIRKSIRRRLEKRREKTEVARVEHVLDSRPPPKVEPFLPGGKTRSGRRSRSRGGEASAESSGTERRSVAAERGRTVRRSSASIQGGSRPSSAMGGAILTEDESDVSEVEVEDRPFEHGPTELPPRPGVGLLLKEKKKPKIPGSMLDRLPPIDAKLDELERAFDRFTMSITRKAFENSMLPGLYFPLEDVQPLWQALGGVGPFHPASTCAITPSSCFGQQAEVDDADDEGD